MASQSDDLVELDAAKKLTIVSPLQMVIFALGIAFGAARLQGSAAGLGSRARGHILLDSQSPIWGPLGGGLLDPVGFAKRRPRGA